MKFVLSVMLVMLLGTHSGLSCSASSTEQTNSSAEEYAVYTAIIGQMFSRTEVKLLVIEDHTVTNHLGESEDWQGMTQQLPTISQQIIGDYKTKNKETQQLKDAFDLKAKHVLIRKDEMEQIFKKGPQGWDEFYKRYPDSGGYIGFSRVGFNPDINQALVYVENGCGGLCGTGHYVLLSKNEGVWKVVNRHMSWIS